MKLELLLLPNFNVSEKIKKAVIRQGICFALFCHFIPLILRWKGVENHGRSEIVVEAKFEGFWDKLGSRKILQRETVTKYLRLTLVFMKNNTLLEKFNCYFSGFFCYYYQHFSFTRGHEHFAIILSGLETLLIFLNLLRSWVSSRSGTREATRLYHVHK